MSRSIRVGAIAAALCFARLGAAQSTWGEVEPNGTKTEADVPTCIASGDAIVGLTQGSLTTPGDSAPDTADMFVVQTCVGAPGLYRHRVTLTTSGVDEFSLSLRGLSVHGSPTPGIDAGSDVALSYAPLAPGQRFVQWFGFGRGEAVYLRITGTPQTLAPYRLALDSVPVAPTIVPFPVASGSVTITTVGQGHNTDTEVRVFDASFNAIPGWANDDAPGGGTQQSTLTRNFTAGPYWIAIGRFNVANDQLSGHDESFATGAVMDWPDGLVSTSPSGPSNVSFSITDANGAHPIAAALPAEPFPILWYRMTVVDPVPPVVPVCFGDGSGSACPCGNSGSVGRGCANSVSPIGALLASNGLASVSLDTFHLVGSGMPISSALYFQGTTLLNGGNGAPFGDGLRCVGTGVLRLATKTNFGGGSIVPSNTDLPISVRGQLPPTGGVRHYQVWYRNSDPTYCTSAYYNLTNALTVTWVL